MDLPSGQQLGPGRYVGESNEVLRTRATGHSKPIENLQDPLASCRGGTLIREHSRLIIFSEIGKVFVHESAAYALGRPELI